MYCSAKENTCFFFDANNHTKRLLHVSLVVSSFCLTFAAKMIFSINANNKMCTVIQRNFDFSASFNAYYLANPNNLLTHGRATYYVRVRARNMPRNPYRKRIPTEFLLHAPCPVMSKKTAFRCRDARLVRLLNPIDQ